MPDILTQIYNEIDPFRPLEPEHPAYVDCEAERGETNIFLDLGSSILRSQKYTCQLYAGHRGLGKSTELLRLKADLESKGCYPFPPVPCGEPLPKPEIPIGVR